MPKHKRSRVHCADGLIAYMVHFTLLNDAERDRAVFLLETLNMAEAAELITDYFKFEFEDPVSIEKVERLVDAFSVFIQEE